MSIAAVPCVLAAQQRGAALSPFATLYPSGNPQTMAGLAFSLGGGMLALRAGAHMAVQEHTRSDVSSVASSLKPWGADADALLYLERLSYGEHLSFSPYVFTGIGASAIDSGTTRVSRHDWSYGGGLNLPLGGAFSMFGEGRWRLSRFVLPNARDAPS